MGKKKSRESQVVGSGEGRRNTEQIAMINMTQSWRQVFDRLDRDGDGYIKMNEIRNILESTGTDRQLDEAQLQRLYKYADKNNDQRLSLEEFDELMNSPALPSSWRRRFQSYGQKYVKAIVPSPVGAGPSDGDEIDYSTEFVEQYNCNPPPIFIVLISIVELGVFLYYGITMGGITASGPVPYSSPLIYDPYRRYEAWRYLSYMLIHSGFMHITFNLLMQLLLGIPLEMVHKWWRVAIVYFAGVIAGSLGTSISDPTVYLAGASAGDYAIITAHLATVILNWKEMAFAWLQVVFFVIIIGTDVGTAVYYRYAGGSEQKTGYSAHLAGAIAGLLVGIGVLRNLNVRPWEKKLWWACLILYGTLMLIAIIWNAAFPDYFPPPK